MRRFLGLTRAFGGATKRCKKSSLVVSLLSNCLPQCASEAADLPGRAGLLSRLRALKCNTPPTPGGENVTVFTSFFLPPVSIKRPHKFGSRLGPVKIALDGSACPFRAKEPCGATPAIAEERDGDARRFGCVA